MGSHAVCGRAVGGDGVARAPPPPPRAPPRARSGRCVGGGDDGGSRCPGLRCHPPGRGWGDDGGSRCRSQFYLGLLFMDGLEYRLFLSELGRK